MPVARYFPHRGPWLADLEAELFAFPNSLHDDQVDSISQALAYDIPQYGWDEKSIAGLARFTGGVGLQEALWGL